MWNLGLGLGLGLGLMKTEGMLKNASATIEITHSPYYVL